MNRPLANHRSTNTHTHSRRDPLTAAIRPCLETLEGRLLMDGEFGSLVTRGVAGNEVAHAAAYDRDGNGIVAGSFAGTVDFSPGGVNVFLDAAAGSGYVAKYNTSGSMVWVRQLGGTVNDVVTDKHGNVFATGSFSGTKDFDSTAGTTNLTSAGFEDIFIAKFNSSGALQWAKRVGGSQFTDVGTSIGVDNTGNVYVGGSFAGSVDFNPGIYTAFRTAQSLTDGFVLKLTSNGTYARVSQLAGTGSEYINDLAVDGNGSVYATGRFDKTADFNPESGSTLMFANASQGTNYDGFVWRLKSNGSLGYAKRFGGGLWDEGNAIAIDTLGNAYVTGKFTYSAWFNNSTGGTLNAFGNSGSDVFVAKYDSEGGFKWTKKLGSGEHDEAGMDIAVDGGRNVYLTGYVRGNATLNPNGVSLGINGGGTDAFMTVLNTDGGFHHAVRYGGVGNDVGRAIAVDAVRGDVWLAGSFQNTVDFNPKAGVVNATSAGGTDLYLLRLKRTASPLEWALTAGLGASIDEGHFIETDSKGNVYVAGLLRGYADLDPSAGSQNYGPIGSGADVFVAKFAPDGTYLWSRVATHRENPNWSLGDEKIGGLAVDASGNVIVVGSFLTEETKLDFPNTDQDLQTVNGYTDAFIWKLNTNGGHVFARQFGDDEIETADGVTVDAAGNIYVTGTFSYEVQWGPESYHTIKSYNDSLGHYSSQDVWTAKYSPSGDIQWVTSSGGEGVDAPTGIAYDPVNNQVHVVGTFAGQQFRANHMLNYGLFVQRTGTLDAFAVRFNADHGASTQLSRFGGTGVTRATAVDVDPSGNLWVGGEFTGTTDLDPKQSVMNRTSNGDQDAFVVKLDFGGSHLFSTKMGAGSEDRLTGLDVNGSGQVLLSGAFRNNVDFDHSNLKQYTLNGGSGSSFVWTLNNSGTFRSAHKFAFGANDITAGEYGSALVVGTFTSLFGADFDPGLSTTLPLSGPSGDIFVMRFQPGTTPSSASPFEEAGASVFNGDSLVQSTASDLLNYLRD